MSADNEKQCDDVNGVNSNGGGESDDDATLNEMMGKFDESYCYERETDILRYSEIIKMPFIVLTVK